MENENRDKIIWGAISLVTLIIIWYFASRLKSMNMLVPNPIDVFKFLYHGTYEPIGTYSIWGHILWSMSRVMVGYVLAAIFGIILGIAMAWTKTGEAIIRPFYLMIRPIPSIAWIPLAILWFGIAEQSKYFIIFIGTLLIIMTNVADGVRSVDKNLLGAARMLGATEKQLFHKVVLPSAVPQIFSGLQVGLGVSWATMIAAELVRSSEGLGWIIIMGQDSVNMPQIYGGILLIGIVGLIIVTLMRGVESSLCKWNVRGR
ncbi:MAG TPA: ABC transporter permease [Firmicutes bacterium]|jgi:ABC-type nitrate/sulfonate/bicarbonate transport system permease component|nr:ABC transporter permease [Bacillota bacterium]